MKNPALAQEKMHCVTRRTYQDNQKVCEEGKFYSQNKSFEKENFKASLEDSEISSLNSRNFDKRCAVLTVYTPESIGLWRIVAVPPECIDHSNQLGSVAQSNMEGLHLVSPSSINSFKFDRWKARKGSALDVTYPVKSFTPRRFPGSDERKQSHNRTLANKVTNLNEFSSNSSSQSSIICNNSLSVAQRRSSSFKSSSIFIENPDIDNIVKRNLRHKARKKGKQNRKISRDSASTGPQVLSKVYAHGVLASETSGNIDMDNMDGLVSSVTSLENSSVDSRISINHVEDNNRISNCSESPNTCTSCIHEVNLSEAEVPSSIPSFPGSLTDSKMMIQMEDQGSVTDGGVEEAHHLQNSCYDGIYSNRFSDMHDSQVLDSVSVVSNSNSTNSASCNTKSYDRECKTSVFSESVDFRSGKRSSSPPNLLSSFVGLCDYPEGMRHGNQGLNRGDVQVAVPGKRKKKAKMVQGSSSTLKPRSARNSRVRTGNENNHCVWQKVQKNDADECNSESKKAVCSQFHGTLKEPSSLRRTSDVTDVNIPSKTEDRKQTKDKVSRKLKRKISPGSRQVNNSNSQRSAYPRKSSSNARGKICSQQNENLDISAQVKNQKRVSSTRRCRSQIGYPEFGFQNSKCESLNSESLLGLQDCPEKLESTESVSNPVSVMNECQDNSLEASCSLLDKMDVLETGPPVYLSRLIVNGAAHTEKDTSIAEQGKQNHIARSPPQKWKPIGTKDRQKSTSVRCGGLQLTHVNGKGPEDWTWGNNVAKNAASHSESLVSSLNVEMMSMGLDSKNNSLEFEKNDQDFWSMNGDVSKGNNHVAADCLIDKSKDKNFPAFETDVNKILHAVDIASRMQAASEAVYMTTGGLIAEFERFLHFSSPVICHSQNLISCKNCSDLHVVGASLCRHETPNVSLGCLWKWYEKHGSYGLEVKAEDCEQSNRLGVDRFSFRAYFVPFLSAIQLFRNSQSHSSNDSYGFPTSEVSGTSATGQELLSTANIGHLPIFSVLVPQPPKRDPTSLPPAKELYKSERSSVSDKDDLSVTSGHMTMSDDIELLFEYFESEQPRQRQPLYEKIQELVTGKRPSNCSVKGDPTKLNTINLHDLHPMSWYAVAWYPIYRIPDGNFRAAFLTYHSLGHMVPISAKVDSGEACIVSPVVGLQSYNAQSECWFQQRHKASSQTAEISSLNPSGILKERLRTLEETASVMSRAVINKGNKTSAKRHSDYEFFLSRRRNGFP